MQHINSKCQSTVLNLKKVIFRYETAFYQMYEIIMKLDYSINYRIRINQLFGI